MRIDLQKKNQLMQKLNLFKLCKSCYFSHKFTEYARPLGESSEKGDPCSFWFASKLLHIIVPIHTLAITNVTPITQKFPDSKHDSVITNGVHDWSLYHVCSDSFQQSRAAQLTVTCIGAKGATMFWIHFSSYDLNSPVYIVLLQQARLSQSRNKACSRLRTIERHLLKTHILL